MAFEVLLRDGLTGRIAIRNHGAALENLPGTWELTLDGRITAAGKFLTGRVEPDTEKELLLGVEVPATYPGEKIFLQVTIGAQQTSLPLPVYMHKPFPRPQEQYTTGVRADAAQAIISGGKLAAVITANGMRELRFRGGHLLASPPRLMLWQHDAGVNADVAALELDRIRISADRFGSDGTAVECHALALPRRMDLDELEFTQRFEPLTSGAIRYETEFIVPDSFTGVPRLGVEFALPSALKFAGYCHPESGMSQVAPEVPAEMEFAQFRTENGDGLLIAAAGRGAMLQVLPYLEYDLLDTASPRQDGRSYLTIDCRNCCNGQIGSGRFRMVLIFAPLTGGEDAALKARSLRFF